MCGRVRGKERKERKGKEEGRKKERGMGERKGKKEICFRDSCQDKSL